MDGVYVVLMSNGEYCVLRRRGFAMLSNAHFSHEEACPVSDEFLGDLYRSNSQEVSVLVGTVRSETRASLALYCFRRAHLHDIGLAIAATCNEEDLDSLGAAGTLLHLRSREDAPKRVTHYQALRRMVTLSTGPLHSFSADSNYNVNAD
jgi:hypothetical protein